MARRWRRVLLAVLTVSLLGPPAAAEPQEDSYYPQYGDPGVDVQSYRLEVVWQRAREILRGVAHLQLRATTDAPSFQLALTRSMSVGHVYVDYVEVPVARHGADLRIEAQVRAGTTYDVLVTYQGHPRPVAAPTSRKDVPKLGLRSDRQGALSTMQEPYGAFTWYPVNDQPSDKALYDITITAPRAWVGVSNGRLLGRHTARGRTVTHFRTDHPAASYQTTLAVGPFVLKRDAGPHGLPLLYWLPRGRADRYLPTLRRLPDDLRWLERKLGAFPFESAGVVVVPGDTAIETQQTITVGSGVWDPERSEGNRQMLVHELAHQWYGDTVTPRDWRDLWLNEGMASYLDALWMADHKVRKWTTSRKNFRFFNTYVRESEGGPGAYDPQDFAGGCVYFCTAAMFDVLRTRFGEDDFWWLVRHWPGSHRDGNADRADYEAFVEQRTGADLTRFFDDWLNSPVWPPED